MSPRTRVFGLENGIVLVSLSHGRVLRTREHRCASGEGSTLVPLPCSLSPAPRSGISCLSGHLRWREMRSSLVAMACHFETPTPWLPSSQPLTVVLLVILKVEEDGISRGSAIQWAALPSMFSHRRVSEINRQLQKADADGCLQHGRRICIYICIKKFWNAIWDANHGRPFGGVMCEQEGVGCEDFTVYLFLDPLELFEHVNLWPI